MAQQIAKVVHRSINGFSGAVITGTIPAFPAPPTTQDSHQLRCLYLTSMVESGGCYGSIMMADGTGCTASLEQLVAVYPKDLKNQGSLFKLMARIQDHLPPVEASGEKLLISKLLREKGWYVASDGTLRDTKTKNHVSPVDIRNEFTPTNGVVPPKGPEWEKCRSWALAFHELFTHPGTFDLQKEYGLEQMHLYADSVKPRGMSTIQECVYHGKYEDANPFGDLWTTDLAMAMFWNYKVNAPSKAKEFLGKATAKYYSRDPKFGPYFLSLIRSTKYAKWSTNRYDRSREYAMKVWPANLFFGPDAIMPKRAGS
jgi:hypothetical protein